MSKVFLDTGYVLALELANDQHHRDVSNHWSGLPTSIFSSLITTSYVFDEIVTFFNCRGYHAKAVEVGGNLLRSAAIEIIHVDKGLLKLGWQYLSRHQDKRYSLTDCISFVEMERLGIATAFSVDHHFEQVGFKIEP